MNPPPLKKNDKVALISPAGKIVEKKIFSQAVDLLRSWDLQPVLMPHASDEYGCFAGTVENRLKDLQEAFDAQDIKAIFCARGGYGLMQIIGQLDLTKFLQNPKLIIGYSDVTVLHNVASYCGVVSLHAPMLRSLVRNELSDSLMQIYRQMLFGEMPNYKIEPHSLNRYGRVTGKIVGGNLAVFSALRGTAYDLNFTNKMLFIEDIAEKPHSVDRMLQNLKLGGVFDSISALIVGQFTDYEEDEGMCRTLYELIADVVAEYSFPVVFNFPAGHVTENYPLLFSYDCTLMVDNESVTLDFIDFKK
jgi:muramoyltetrapeptide carboxypeptidase